MAVRFSYGVDFGFQRSTELTMLTADSALWWDGCCWCWWEGVGDRFRTSSKNLTLFAEPGVGMEGVPLGVLLVKSDTDSRGCCFGVGLYWTAELVRLRVVRDGCESASPSSLPPHPPPWALNFTLVPFLLPGDFLSIPTILGPWRALP